MISPNIPSAPSGVMAATGVLLSCALAGWIETIAPNYVWCNQFRMIKIEARPACGVDNHG
jgi:hypothetical protein